MRILHLSDIHLDSNSLYKSQKLLDGILATIQPFQKEKVVDVVICTGDIINRGGITTKQGISTSFSQFLYLIIDPLLKKLELPRSRFVFCPGNHDVDRETDTKYTEKGLSDELMTEEAIEDLMHGKNVENVVGRMRAFKKFEKEYYSPLDDIEYKYGYFDSSLKLQIDGVSVGFSLLNSAWRCWNSQMDKSHLLIGREQIVNSMQHIHECDVKIALAHHSTSWLADFDAMEVQKQIIENYDMFFTGHTHSSDYCYEIKPNGSTFNVVAPGVLSSNISTPDTKYKNGFSLVDYDLVEGTFQSRLFYQENLFSFAMDHNHGESGVWLVNVPLGKESISRRNVVKLLLDIKEEANHTNEHLLSYKTKSCAPKAVSQIFVEPVLTMRNAPDGDILDSDNEANSSNITMSDMLSSKSNYVLFGIKESGKTLILDKLLIDVLQHEGGCNEIPAIINFCDLRRSVEDCVNIFWRQDIHKTREILAKDNVLLLIDNIDFSDTNRLQIIFDFLLKNDNVRYIGTTLSSWAQDENLNIYNQPLQNFKRVEIEQFKSHQIRELIAKWIDSKSRKADVQKRVNSIVDAFLHLNIPRTPFAISMFLRILERQESYKPQNNAVLIKSYIEDLLKEGDNSASREEFDYINKSTVLAEIAYCMLKEENTNYAVKVSTVQSIIEKKLSDFHFRKVYSANKIYTDFVKIGIFTLEPNNMIRFRFTCFFEYFLYLRMEKNSVFLDEILLNENYLKYYNEMVFYTGINRGDSRIIKKIMQDLEYDYIDINQIVFDSINGVDEFFNVGSSVLQRIRPDDLINVLPDKETEETNDADNDNALAQSETETEIENKKKNSNKFNNYSRLLLLAMDVLKNCEEFPELEENPTESKGYYYNLVLRNSISFTILYRLIVVEMIKHPNRFPPERLDDLKFTIRLLPVLHEELLRSHLGTYKLTEIIKDKIDKDVVGDSIPEFERYLSVFLYSDLKGPDYMNILMNFMKSFSRAYIADACYFKLLAYYYSSKDKSLDNKLINLLGDLYVKMNSSKSKQIRKSAVIASLQSRKSIANRN